MRTDIRQTALYRDAEALYRSLHQPGAGKISDVAELHVAPGGQTAAFSGVIMDALDGVQSTRICEVDLTSGKTWVKTLGPHTDRLPKYSPDGRWMGFVSDRHKSGDFQLYLIDLASGATRAAPRVEGWVEYFHWSPDGRRILLGVAGYGADIAGGHGAITTQQVTEQVPSWVPIVETREESYRWRRAWIYEIAPNSVRRIGPADANVWEVVWCGSGALAAVVSPGAAEGLWYSARIHVIDLELGTSREVYRPTNQLGLPAASPSGRHVAIIEALCSDRCIVAGDLQIIDTASGEVRRINTVNVDVTYTEWRSERHLLVAGHRGFETVIGLYDSDSDEFNELWASHDLTAGGFYAAVAGFAETGDCVLVGEGFKRAPEIAVIRQGQYKVVRSFDLGYVDQVEAIEAVERVTWLAPDGLEIQGWLLLPRGKRPCPLVMNIHGGPVWHWRPMWLGRPRDVPVLMLLKCGYAVFLPNPRGSSGRGQSFAKYVLGDVGGGDALDCLSGLDYLVEQGVADRKRLGVTGGSYGGFMTAWLITQDARFAAAVALAPHTNHITAQLTSNIPHFVSLFLADTYTNVCGKYLARSPIMYADHVVTPTLNICGALDRSAPPEEAVQFHNALRGYGVRSVLVTYPEEGHRVRKFPATIDYAARLVGWFQQYMPASTEHSCFE